MAINKEVEAGLKLIAEDFHLPGGGRKRLSQLVAGHLGWFDAAERRGMGWRDMIRALTAAGVTGKDGKPLSVGTLSSTVWRKRAEGREMDRASHQPQRAPRPIRAQRESTAKAQRPAAELRQPTKPAALPQAADRVHAGSSLTPAKRPTGEVRGQANKDVLAFMDRARAVRRRSEEK